VCDLNLATDQTDKHGSEENVLEGKSPILLLIRVYLFDLWPILSD